MIILHNCKTCGVRLTLENSCYWRGFYYCPEHQYENLRENYKNLKMLQQ